VSFGDQPTLSFWQKVGCIFYLLGAAFCVFYLAVVAAIGDCASDDCLPNSTRLLMFPGSLVVAFIGGYFLTRFFMRDKD
jgi:hypothetical protein